MRQIGILGGGQLGMLLAESVQRHGGKVVIYDPDPRAPAAKTVSQSICATWTDTQAIEKFFGKCDAITYEFENVESGAIAPFENSKPILPSLHVLRTCQDRILEKTFLKDAGLPHVNFAIAKSPQQVIESLADVPFPCVLKTTRGGYDGKGQAFARTNRSIKPFLQSNTISEGLPVIVEAAADIALEVSCIVARSPSGEEIVFPVFENIHKDHILDFTIFPARISEALSEKLQQIATEAARRLDVYGLLTTEFFICRKPAANSLAVECDGYYIYVNEMAPRPHNSGHVTMSACTLSQFDVLARILLSIPMGCPRGLAPGYYCMGNLLGDVWLAQGATTPGDLDLSALAQYPEVIDVVLYGKAEARSKRKMGHFVTYADDAKTALKAAGQFRDSLTNTRVATSQPG